MAPNFICPRCKGYLNVGSHIILAAYSEEGTPGLILLNPEIGNYSVEKNVGFEVHQGKKYDFFCPMCQEKFASELHENLSRIQMLDPEGQTYEVYFSKIAGEESTYKMTGESFDVFGRHSPNYIDFINLSFAK